ncbi:hypothetical protein ACHWQZ_G001305 [Mnemiopsis leidyi]
MLLLMAALIQGLTATTVFDFEVVDIHGVNQKLSQYTGNVTVMLQELHEKYYDQGLRIIGFPCNQFANQEPKTEAEILEFVKQYNVTFPLTSKIKVNGEDAHPLWKWLKSQIPGPGKIQWNFTKFLSGRDGIPVGRFEPREYPETMESDIVALLAENL